MRRSRILRIDRAIEQHLELLRLMLNLPLQIRKLPLERVQLIRQVQTREHSRSRSVDIAGASRDTRHQVIDLMRELLDTPSLLARHKRVALVENRHTDGFRVRHDSACHF